MLIVGCEVNPIIYTPSEPIPVIYAVFDDHDTTHNILITKTFGAGRSPSDCGFIRDSLYWNNLDIEVGLKEKISNNWIFIKPEKVTAMDKDSGFFLYPDHEYYAFNRVLLDTPRGWDAPKTYSIDSISIRVSIPGLEEAFCQHKRIDTIRIVSPHYYQEYLYLTPESPLIFNWDWYGRYEERDTTIIPHAWNEIDVDFEFIEETENGYKSSWVRIQNTHYNDSWHEYYRQLNITYEEFIREVLLQIKNDHEVIRRKLGIINMHISGGDLPIKKYMDLYHGFSDYNNISYTNFQNALGILGTATHLYKDSMRFDYDTRQILINENRFKKIKLSAWSE